VILGNAVEVGFCEDLNEIEDSLLLVKRDPEEVVVGEEKLEVG